MADRLAKRRHAYAAEITRRAGVSDPRIEAAFAAVPREDFAGPPPWRIGSGGFFGLASSDDPARLYEDVLVAIDAERGINNGQPSLHAQSLDALGVKEGETVVQIEQQTQELQKLQDQATQEIAELQHARAERSVAVAALTKKLESGNQELGNLKREEQAVESLVAELARMMQDFPTDPSQSFDRMRGKLPWPVSGSLSARYQAPRENSGGVRWNGVLIATERGAKVRAPFFGRVVYADWLQGLGLLMIVGHSGGYMTLYGHAEVLYKSVGDKVAPGDVIAALSDTEGAKPQLYFEIREGRKTVDPKLWLKTAP